MKKVQSELANLIINLRTNLTRVGNLVRKSIIIFNTSQISIFLSYVNRSNYHLTTLAR